MPTGVYNHYKLKGENNPAKRLEVRKKISEAKKGKPSPMLGRHHSEETKKKMSDAQKGEKSHSFGKHLLKIMKERLSEIQIRIGNKPPSHKGKTYQEIYGNRWQEEIQKRHKTFSETFDKKGRRTYLQRPKHHSWIYKNWVKRVLERDNYTCIWCGQRGGKLHADHIKPFALIIRENNIKTMIEAMNYKKLWDINNGRTLCIDCHKKTETYGGKTLSRMQ